MVDHLRFKINPRYVQMYSNNILARGNVGLFVAMRVQNVSSSVEDIFSIRER